MRRAKSTTKRVWRLDYATLGRRRPRKDLLATFTLDGDQLCAEWHDPDFKREVEQHGIAVASGVYRPSQGRAFFDNLGLAFSTATTTWVEESPQPRRRASPPTLPRAQRADAEPGPSMERRRKVPL